MQRSLRRARRRCQDLYEGDWRNDPYPNPPFAVWDSGEAAAIVDQEGRILMNGYRAKDFVRELVKIMNENSERLVNAWKRSVVA